MDRSTQNSARTRLHVCALKYCLPEERSAASQGRVILFAVKDAEDLRLYLHHALKQQITDSDLPYFDALMKDLLSRLKESPDDVFEQLSNLSVGPIVTDSVEWIDAGQENFGVNFYLYTEAVESVDSF
jgi:hypothetical protein